MPRDKQMVKNKKIRYTGRRATVRSIFFFLMLAAAAYFFLNSSVFDVSEIKVEGNEALTFEEIADLSGIQIETNIFKINLSEAVEKLTLHPKIDQVNISRSFPNTIVIEVSERKTQAVIALDRKFIQICDNGYFLKQVDQVGSFDLPIVTGIDINEPISPGQKIEANEVEGVLKILNLMNRDEKNMIAEIHYGDPTNITMFTVNEIEIILGDTKQLEKKVFLVFEILSRTEDAAIQYLDIRFPKSPVIR